MLFKIIKLRFYISYLKKENNDIMGKLKYSFSALILSLVLVSLMCYFSDNDFKIRYVVIDTMGFLLGPLFVFICDSVTSFKYYKFTITRVGRDKELYELYKSITLFFYL